MPKQFPLILGGIVAVAAIAAVGYFVLGNKTSNPSVETPTAADTSSETGEVSANTLRGLLGLGRNVTCTYENTDDTGNTIAGTVYVSGERMRSDFQNEGPAGEFEGSMISDGEYAYTWSSLFEGGTKMKLDATQEASEDKDNNVDLDEPVDLDCSAWTVDNSMFDLPEGVEFTDISESMMMMEEKTGDVMENVCSQITDPQAKAACESAL